MKSVALHNLGCKVNGYEIDVIQQMLQEKGYTIVAFDEIADIYIVNTCTVTNIADRKSRQMLHKAKRLNPDSIVVAVGCYVQTGEEKILKEGGVDLAVGNNQKSRLIPILEDFLQEREREAGEESPHQYKAVLDDLTHETEYDSMQLKGEAGHTRAYIKIQDGCNQFCSYCIIPYARGRVRSRIESEILDEVSMLAANGYKEVVLTGIHLSSYGTDLESGDLLTLIENIHTLQGIERIRLGSLEPRIITEDFAERLHRLPKVCPHFHLSLQSGCDSVLKRMNRHYTSREYFEKVELLRSIYEMPAITTDVIVGFPGETEEEFESTRKFLLELSLYEMHIFKYSKREGTPAARMENQVEETVKAKRSSILLQMEKAQSAEYRSRYIGKTAKILFEEEKIINEVTYQIGHTKEYIKAALRSEASLVNQIKSVVLTEFLQDDILLSEQ